MNRRRLLAMLPALLPAWLLPAAGAAPAEPLRVVAADLPPYAVAQGGASPGLLVELVQELARRLGTPVTVEFYPWQRALAMATVLPRIAVLPVTRTPERETLYRWLVKLHQQNFVFVALRGGADVRDLTALRRQRLVVLRGSPHKRVLQELDFVDVAECSTVRECMRMVKKGIADATYGGEDIHRKRRRRRRPSRGRVRFQPGLPQRRHLAGRFAGPERGGWPQVAGRAGGGARRRRAGAHAAQVRPGRQLSGNWATTKRQLSGNWAATAAGNGGGGAYFAGLARRAWMSAISLRSLSLAFCSSASCWRPCSA